MSCPIISKRSKKDREETRESKRIYNIIILTQKKTNQNLNIT